MSAISTDNLDPIAQNLNSELHRFLNLDPTVELTKEVVKEAWGKLSFDSPNIQDFVTQHRFKRVKNKEDLKKSAQNQLRSLVESYNVDYRAVVGSYEPDLCRGLDISPVIYLHGLAIYWTMQPWHVVWKHLQKNYLNINGLIRLGVDLNVQDEKGNTVLHDAVVRKDLDLVYGLLAFREIDPNIQNHLGKTPFHEVFIDNGDKRWNKFAFPVCASTFLKNGSCLDICDDEGNTPMHYAYKNYSDYDTFSTVADLFKKYKGCFDLPNLEGKKPEEYRSTCIIS